MTTTYAMPSVGAMTPKTENNSRREVRSERRNYKFLPTIAQMLDAISDRENISETEAVSRAIEKEAKKLPLLGEIACGPLSEIPDDYVEAWLNVGDLFRTRPGDYLLKASGAGLRGCGIEPGDYVWMRPQTTCDSGEVAAVLIDGPVGTTATLKVVEYKEGSPIVRLKPMNDDFEAIEIDTSTQPLRICGVKKGVIKTQ